MLSRKFLSELTDQLFRNSKARFKFDNRSY